MGPGGLHSRIRRHLKKNKQKHWHIDYLRNRTEVMEVWYICSQRKLEHEWARRCFNNSRCQVPLQGFGSSDCTCLSHLFFFQHKPSPALLSAQVQKPLSVVTLPG
jgi:Uri superfamily endonuclease